MTQPLLLSRLASLSTVALLALSAGCLDEDLATDDLTTDQAADLTTDSTGEGDEPDATTDVLRTSGDELRSPNEDLRVVDGDGATAAILLCVVESATFSPSSLWEHHTTTKRPCVVHSVDLNLSAAVDFGGQWATATFPQYIGPWTLTRELGCQASYVQIKRSEKTGSDYELVSTKKGYGVTETTYIGGLKFILGCKASYGTNCGITPGSDLQRFSVRPVVGGDLDAPLDGAEVQHDASKGNPGSCF